MWRDAFGTKCTTSNGDVDNDYEMKKGIYEYFFPFFLSLYEKQRRILIRYLARFLLCREMVEKVIT
jgi:hypothetical protein